MKRIWVKRCLVLIVCIFAVVQTIRLHNCKRTIENQKVIIKNYEALSLNDDKDYQEVMNQLKEANQRIAEIEQKQICSTTDDMYLNNKFPFDGIYYKEAYDEVQFYSDITCTQEIYNIRFMSCEIDNCTAKNGLSVYCLRMDNGKICYCTQMPYLITEDKYEEMHEEN